MTRIRYAMHRTPTYAEIDGKWKIIGVRYFPLVKPCVAFAKKQMEKRGARGYSIQSLTREHVADLLMDHVPLSACRYI